MAQNVGLRVLGIGLLFVLPILGAYQHGMRVERARQQTVIASLTQSLEEATAQLKRDVTQLEETTIQLRQDAVTMENCTQHLRGEPHIRFYRGSTKPVRLTTEREGRP